MLGKWISTTQGSFADAISRWICHSDKVVKMAQLHPSALCGSSLMVERIIANDVGVSSNLISRPVSFGQLEAAPIIADT